MSNLRPTTSASTIERIIAIVVLTGVVLLVGFNLGLSVARHREEQAGPRDSTPLQGSGTAHLMRYRTTSLDTTEGNVVLETIEDLIWHEATLVVRHDGERIALIEVSR